MLKLLPTVLVLVLLGATAAAFTVTQRLKLEDSPILNVQLDRLVSPVCTVCKKPEAREALIRFRLVEEDDVRIDIVDAEGTMVRESLVSGRYEPKFLRFSWDGRDGGGRLVADGIYRVRVTLEGEGRTLEFPQEIRVDATVPTVEDIEVRPAVFSPDGDGRADQANVIYRFSEAAYPVLYVDGRRQTPGRRRLAGAFQWYALQDGHGLPPGEHRLALAAQDPVGNLSPSTREFTVRIRYVELRRQRYRTRPGARLRVRVSTDAPSLRYRLAGRGRVVEGRVRRRRAVRAFILRVPRRAGRYLLTVRVNGRLDRAVLLVAR